MGAATAASVEAPTHQLAHRGPDGERWLTPAPWVSLGHARLRVIDLSPDADQPIANEDQSVWVVLNGEIYDFQAHRAELLARGHRFRSHGDTEVVAHLYEERGEDAVAALNGMFALAIVDLRRGKVVLARDRAGKKPLYYRCDARGLTFGSEPKAIAAVAGAWPSVDVTCIPELLQFGYVLAPGSAFEGVKRLRPGSLLTWTRGGETVDRSYWILPRPTAPALEGGLAQVRTLVARAVQRRLVADVPLGAFLSGGIDSAVVTYEMARAGGRVRTFSVAFEEGGGFDESVQAAWWAKRLGTDHTEIRVRADAADVLEEIPTCFDEPFGDSSAIPTWLVSREARRHVSVVLTGDGGDEVFAGYRRFVGLQQSQSRLGSVAAGAGQIVTRLPSFAQEGYGNPLAYLRRFAAVAGASPARGYLGWVSIFDSGMLAGLLRPELQELVGAAEDRHAALMADATSPLDGALRYNFLAYLEGDLLAKVDRMSMAHGLETRAPFLDRELVESCFGVAGAAHVRLGVTKQLLRRAYAGRIPARILLRRKHGFGVPVDEWFRAGLAGYVQDRLLGQGARIHEYVRKAEVLRLLEEHRGRQAGHGARLYSLLMLELWLERLARPPLEVSRLSAGLSFENQAIRVASLGGPGCTS